MKKQLRMIIDIVMTVLMPMLMAYSLIGEMFHEIIGTVIFALFIIHHILNRKWYRTLLKGKYNARRIFQTLLNMLLLIFMILQPVSGILMSRHLYTFLPSLPVSALSRNVHMLLAYWGYVLLCIHAGTHLTAPLKKFRNKKKRGFTALCLVLGGISAYGIYAFIKRGFPGYMSGSTAFAFFDFGEPVLYFFLDYLAIMILFMMLGALIFQMLGRIKPVRSEIPG